MKRFVHIAAFALSSTAAYAIEIETPTSPGGLRSAPEGAEGLRAAPQAPVVLRSEPELEYLLVAREEEDLSVTCEPTALRIAPERPQLNTSPKVEEIVEGLQNDYPIRLMRIEFEHDSARLTSQAREEVAELAQGLRLAGGGPFLIIGNTDLNGAVEYNRALSLRRAKAVAQELIDRHGFDVDQLRVEGHGEENPIDFTGTAEGDQRNRRVEVKRVAG
ncbi:OmpA family protein [Aliiroseovarius crassostreae]|uniref:OmpA family protein n=1 Tax=Aliiroseovarius crassostreae TaxID=154981 RepID=UPI002206ECE8|nr:OmpA family protein [Aliiroseovarius crassostreae]UWQ05937.1 OmpA family protein [Aliiroseovarius crassostreae]